MTKVWAAEFCCYHCGESAKLVNYDLIFNIEERKATCDFFIPQANCNCETHDQTDWEIFWKQVEV